MINSNLLKWGVETERTAQIENVNKKMKMLPLNIFNFKEPKIKLNFGKSLEWKETKNDKE